MDEEIQLLLSEMSILRHKMDWGMIKGFETTAQIKEHYSDNLKMAELNRQLETLVKQTCKGSCN